MTDAFFQISDIDKSYGTTSVLKNVSIDVSDGDFLVLLGPSGCGKSTLLRILAGLLEADSGRLTLGGADITAKPAWDRDIGFVFQNYALFPHMSVARNVAFGLDMRRLPRAEIAIRVEEALEAVRLTGYGNRMPGELSGGQQQRVAIARAIAIRPRLLLLDEPLSNLDAVLRASVRSELRDLHDRTGITTIMVTHDQAEAMSVADRVVLMSEGRVIQNDTPEVVYRNPATAFAASFIGNPPANILDVSADAADWSPTLKKRLSDFAAPVVLAARPEDIRLYDTPRPGGLPASLKRIEFQGSDRFAHVETLNQRAIVRLSEGQAVAGPDVWLEVPDAAPIYSAETGTLANAPEKGEHDER